MTLARDLVLSSCVSTAVLALTACVGTTGGDLVTFAAAAAGPADAVAGQPYQLPSPTDHGYEVTLTQAILHVGAVYLEDTVPASGAQDTSCVLPGIYVAQVTGGPDGGLDVDVLSPDPQPFPVQGQGVAIPGDPAKVGEVWLMHGDVNDSDDVPILQLAGTAVGPNGTYPFTASLTISENRLEPVTSPATPSQHPICKQHIVSPIALASSISPMNGGSLLLRIDPSGWFVDVDFSQLEQSTTSPPLYAFADANVPGPSKNLYDNLHTRSSPAVYDFRWIDSPNP
jgi:hypothetical protein